MAYGWAVAFGTLCAILTALASLMLWFLGSYEGDSSTGGPESWLVVVAAVLFACAIAIFVGVMTARVWSVAAGVLAGVAVSTPAVRYILVELSDHGDGEVIAFALGVVVAGLLALALTAMASRELEMTDERPQ